MLRELGSDCLTLDRSTCRTRILWVEDDPHLAASFARQLQLLHDIDVMHAYDGMQGLWMAASEKPDVVITDLKMPNLSGSDLLEALRLNRQLTGIPTIVVTGYDTPADRKRLRQLGVSAVLTKPVTLDDLLAELRKLIDV